MQHRHLAYAPAPLCGYRAASWFRAMDLVLFARFHSGLDVAQGTAKPLSFGAGGSRSSFQPRSFCFWRRPQQVQNPLVHILATVCRAQFAHGVMNPIQDSLPHSLTDPVEEIHRVHLHAKQISHIAGSQPDPPRRAGTLPRDRQRVQARFQHRSLCIRRFLPLSPSFQRPCGKCARLFGQRTFPIASQRTELASGPVSG